VTTFKAVKQVFTLTQRTPLCFCVFDFVNDNDNEREFVQRVVINKSRTRYTLWCRRCCANRTVFKCRRKQASLIVGSLNATGRLFHTVGPATENARRPYVVSL